MMVMVIVAMHFAISIPISGKVKRLNNEML